MENLKPVNFITHVEWNKSSPYEYKLIWGVGYKIPRKLKKKTPKNERYTLWIKWVERRINPSVLAKIKQNQNNAIL